MSKQITVDLNKVQWATYHWRNQEGLVTRVCPSKPSARGVPIKMLEYASPHPDYPHETMLERAIRLGILDVWTPVCKLIVSANRTLTFTGEKATSIWKAYNKHIYSK